MLKILQARLHQYVNQFLPDVQDDFRKGRATRDQIANIHWITEKARGFQKNICFIDYVKAFDCVDHNKLWKILKRDGNTRPPYLPPANLYAGQEATLRTEHEQQTGSKLGKEYIMWNAGLDEAGIKTARRNINNFRYADDTTLLAESEEELKSLLMKANEES